MSNNIGPVIDQLTLFQYQLSCQQIHSVLVAYIVYENGLVEFYWIFLAICKAIEDTSIFCKVIVKDAIGQVNFTLLDSEKHATEVCIIVFKNAVAYDKLSFKHVDATSFLSYIMRHSDALYAKFRIQAVNGAFLLRVVVFEANRSVF